MVHRFLLLSESKINSWLETDVVGHLRKSLVEGLVCHGHQVNSLVFMCISTLMEK